VRVQTQATRTALKLTFQERLWDPDSRKYSEIQIRGDNKTFPRPQMDWSCVVRWLILEVTQHLANWGCSAKPRDEHKKPHPNGTRNRAVLALRQPRRASYPSAWRYEEGAPALPSPRAIPGTLHTFPASPQVLNSTQRTMKACLCAPPYSGYKCFVLKSSPPMLSAMPTNM